jgi:diguanylate cyclase (GGDEF)-like protein/PAS domain S-box-containing protein
VIKDFYKELVDNLHDGVYFIDRERVITYWNKGAERITGYSADEMVGRACRDKKLEYTDANGVPICGVTCPLAACMQDGKLRRAEVFLQHADGQRVPIMLRAKPLTDERGEIVGAIESFYRNESLITTRHQLHEMRRTALTDPLTGVSNRRHLEGRLHAVIAEYNYASIGIGLLLIDIDRFKQINDEFGHDIGDKVLQRIAGDLRQNLRTGDTVGRWAGDEFMAILYDVKDVTDLRRIATKLHKAVEYSNLDFASKNLVVTVSVGATLMKPGDSPQSLVRRADDLMYFSKSVGRNLVTVG